MQPCPWHQPLWARARSVLKAGRVPHAWLLRGAAGTGKAAFAERLARVLLCEQHATGEVCGECRGCRLSAAGTHPDYLRVDIPEKKTQIPVESIRDLIDQAVLARAMGSYKPIVVPQADALTNAAGNALLKILEEPPAGTVFLLVSHASATLLPTIRSRCQHFDLPAPTPEQSLAWLSGQGLDGERARQVLDMADGAPMRALELAEDETVAASFAALRRQIWDLVRGRASAVEVAGEWSRLPIDLLLGWMLAAGNSLVRRRVAEARDGNTAAPDVRRLYAILDEVLDARRAVGERANLNARLVLESLAVAWSRARERA